MEKINKRLLGVEDVNWDETGNGETDYFIASDGTQKPVHKVNESHIPVSAEIRECFPEANHLNDVISKIFEMLNEMSVGSSGEGSTGGLISDVIVDIPASSSATEIQAIIDLQTKNLGKKTITFKFPENTYQSINQQLVFSEFFNGKIIVDGNQSTMRDPGDIGSMFKFDLCLCYIEVKNCTFNIENSSCAIYSNASLGMFVSNCNFRGSSKGVFAVNAIMSDAIFEECSFSDCEEISGSVYKRVKDKYFQLSGGTINGSIVVTGGISVQGNATVGGNKVVLKINNKSADASHNVNISISDIPNLKGIIDAVEDEGVFYDDLGTTAVITPDIAFSEDQIEYDEV